MPEKREEDNIQTMIANGMLYLAVLISFVSIAVFGLDGFLDNQILSYSSQILLISSVVISFLPYEDKSFERLFNRSAGGLLLIALLSSIELIYYKGGRLKTSTLLTDLALSLLLAVSSYKAVLTRQKRAYGREAVDLLGAGLTAFGALIQPIATRLGLQQPATMGFFGIPLIVIGLAVLFYSRFILKR